MTSINFNRGRFRAHKERNKLSGHPKADVAVHGGSPVALTKLAVVKREETEAGSIVIIDNWLANFQRKQ